MSDVGVMRVYRAPTIEELNDTIAAERKRANDAWAAACMEREVAEAYKADAMRYRHIREHGDMAPIYVPKRSGFGNVMTIATGEQLDRALDEAMHAATAGSPE